MAAKKAESKAKAKEAFSWFWENEEEEKKEKRAGQRQAVEKEQETIVATMKDLPSWVRLSHEFHIDRQVFVLYN